jgi:hypothetical protein
MTIPAAFRPFTLAGVREIGFEYGRSTRRVTLGMSDIA